MKLRRATQDDAQWINAAYATVHFQPSDVERELIIVAEANGERHGMGRLVPAGDEAWELGGMLVFEPFRGRGVARAIIDELLRHAGERDVYCIPFAELEPIYAKAGFAVIDEDDALPEYVRKKMAWCRSEVDRPVLLMKKR